MEAEDKTSYLLTEFSELRNEILKRLEFQHQMVSLSLVVAGTFLTVGFIESISFSIFLVYPIISFFLAASWAQNAIRIRQIAEYIETKIENSFSKKKKIGFQNYKKLYNLRSRWGPFSSLAVFSARGVFFSTQLLLISLSLFTIEFSKINIVLLSVDGLLLILTLLLLHKGKY